MITLQNLIDFAKENALDPNKCVLLLAEKMLDGEFQCDYLYKLRLAKNEEVMSHDDKMEIVPIGLVMEVLPW